MKILKNIILAPFTTFKIGGPADYFVEADTEKEIIEAVTWAKEKNLKYYILGAGSNVLIMDKGVRGMVIKVKSQSANWRIKIKNNHLYADAGVLLNQAILYASKHNLSGLEGLTGIPGTVGGAIVGNAGTKNFSISQAVDYVLVVDNQGKIKKINKQECQFDYRTSRFQTSKEIILNATFKLRKEKPQIITKKIKSILSRRKNQPVGFSAGSIFKNPRLAAAAYLIENAGLKGKTIGDAYISTKHANWIINKNKARAQDVIKLINMIKLKVQTDFKVKLKEEIIILGEQ